MRIQHNDNLIGGVFFIEQNKREIAEMTYDYDNMGNMIINHTGVRPEFEGRGIGKKMIAKAVEFARANDIKIIPLCSFASRMLEAVPEYQDVLAEEEED